jgi:hypothetical protein
MTSAKRVPSALAENRRQAYVLGSQTSSSAVANIGVGSGLQGKAHELTERSEAGRALRRSMRAYNRRDYAGAIPGGSVQLFLS